jgi:hypothetical protein
MFRKVLDNAQKVEKFIKTHDENYLIQNFNKISKR